MKPSRRFSPILCIVLVAAALGVARRADAVTIEDIIGLTRAGLSDEVLVALVETDGTVFTLTPAQLIELKKAGVSERVMVSMLWQGRTPIPDSNTASETSVTQDVIPGPPSYPYPPPVAAPEATVVVVPTVVPWPYYVQVPHRPFPQRPFVSVRQPHIGSTPQGFGRFMNTYGRFINDGTTR